MFDGKKGNGPNATDGLEQCGWSSRPENFIKTFPSRRQRHWPCSGAVAVINPKNMKVEKLFPIPLEDCARPQGMAIGPNTRSWKAAMRRRPMAAGTP